MPHAIGRNSPGGGEGEWRGLQVDLWHGEQDGDKDGGDDGDGGGAAGWAVCGAFFPQGPGPGPQAEAGYNNNT